MTAALVTAIVGGTVTLIVQAVLRYMDSRAARQHEVRGCRRDALHSALEAIDHVYDNSTFGGQPAPRPHAWDISLIRGAFNKMILYCAKPKETIAAFVAATGLHNQETQATPTYGPEELDLFRRAVCRELGVREADFYSDPNVGWIVKLPGAE